MDTELETLDAQMKSDIKLIKDKYNKLKKEVKDKYKKIQKDKIKKEKEEINNTRKTIPKSLKNIVWDKNIGKEKGVGECDVCKCQIDSKSFDCGHIISVKNGGETNESNLLPICATCNKSMGIENLNEFKEKYFKSIKITYQNYTQEYVFSILKESNNFKSIDQIYQNYINWLSNNHNEKYIELTQNTFIDCFGDKTEELKKYLNDKFGSPISSLEKTPQKKDIYGCNINDHNSYFNIDTGLQIVEGYKID
mgnify:CR=1 FL=1